ncbi:MAG: hypothetical protein AAGK17_08945 [Pseudomonadota bacterium]
MLALLAIAGSSTANAAGLILNEVSQGTSGSKEFYEFVVVGNAANPTASINLNGWIIDDNNGDWGGGGTGIGTAPGYSRFDTTTNAALCSALSSVVPGSIIVVYNDADPNLNIPADDLSDTNNDGVYIIPARSDCIRSCAGPPSSSDPSYSACTTAATPSYSRLALRNGGDAAQARDPSGVLFHGFAYGDIDPPIPANSFLVGTTSSTGQSMLFSCGDWFDGGNFSRVSAVNDTPGAANNPANVLFVQNIAAGVFDYGNPSAAANCAAAPQLALTKVADDDTLRVAGDTIIYTYTVTNTGGVIVRDITIDDVHNGSGPAPVPQDEALLTDVAPFGDSTDAAMNGSWDVLAPGDSVTFTGTYTVTPDDILNLQS